MSSSPGTETRLHVKIVLFFAIFTSSSYFTHSTANPSHSPIYCAHQFIKSGSRATLAALLESICHRSRGIPLLWARVVAFPLTSLMARSSAISQQPNYDIFVAPATLRRPVPIHPHHYCTRSNTHIFSDPLFSLSHAIPAECPGEGLKARKPSARMSEKRKLV
jgi:hypothetical protein